ncbi:Retrovirus-related Pol polyprotein from transposon [Apostichopus japonicus]|uniref:Retrovirus-related Pol polyprotein from transposon n=1 Tax=Stichopus japonicus TaxID=307972 RepID=A0A2G8KDU6_STIJA|nr:Retrovirus-related Pol polyprotein from transposon [Apostichopus japonicus]
MNVREVRSFIGLCSYYRRFIRGFSSIAKPLHRLTENGREFKWTNECEESFKELKRRLTSAPVLCYPTKDDPFVLDTDASDQGVGSVLSQIQDGNEVVIGYYSRTLSKQERRYCVTRKELLAIIAGTKWFHHFLYGRKFLIRTDHGAFAEGRADICSDRKACRGVAVQEGQVEQEETSHPPPWSLEDLKKYQRDDPDILPVLQGKETLKRPLWSEVSGGSRTLQQYWLQWESLVLKNDLLYRKFESQRGDKVWLQFVVPEVLRRKIWELAHSHPLSGHFMARKTSTRVRKKFYWSGLSRDIDQWCKICPECQQRRGAKTKQKAKLRRYATGEPLQRVALDIMGPLPITPKGNRYILVIADYFSKWVEVAAIPNQEAVTIAKILIERFICRFGIPDEIHSDQGRQFESKVFQKTCELLRIRKTRTTPYHPQSDGMVERFNRTLETMLSMVVAPNQKDWDTWLPYASLAYNTAVHESTGFSPAELMFGRAVRTPLDIILPEMEEEEGVEYPDFVEELRSRIKEMHKQARDNLASAGARQKRQADRFASEDVYRPGDLVMVHNPAVGKGKTSKLNKPWQGQEYHQKAERCALQSEVRGRQIR